MSGVVCDGEVCGSSDEWTSADVFDDGVCDGVVWNSDEVSICGSYFSASEPNFFDWSVMSLNPYEFVNLKGSVGEDGH